MIRLVVYVVLMCLWLFGGFVATGAGVPSWLPTAHSLIPWLCVAILGWEVYKGSAR